MNSRIAANVAAKLPEQFKGMKNIEALIDSFSQELDVLDEVFEELTDLRSLNTAFGVQLDNAGDIVVLTRAEATAFADPVDFDVMDDERYRLFLKFKALRNSNTCTFAELVEACQLLYDAQRIYYNEYDKYPAHFRVMVGGKFDESLMAILKNSDTTIKPGGVSVELQFFDMEFFGFGDLNRDVLGFGIGKFLHIYGKE